MAQDASALLATMTKAASAATHSSTRFLRTVAAALALILLAGTVAGWWFYRRITERRWAREEAIPQIESLIEAHRPLAAFAVLRKAEKDLPGDPHLRQIAGAETELVSVTSDPSGADVSIQDYLGPKEPAFRLGSTPLKVRLPQGYFRWTVAKPGTGQIVVAPETKASMHFALTRSFAAPTGMVYASGGYWSSFNGFIGWMGPYTFPAYYMDRNEVTNREYQEFVDHGGYERPEYWPAQFQKDGETLSWRQAIQLFQDSTGRPGPATWAAGHYPQGKGNDPVSGVSWFEAAAYAKYAGKVLPVLGQWYQAADFDVSEYTVQVSNLRGRGPAPVGSFPDSGQYGTHDMAGNVREWIANSVDGDLRFILGGSALTQLPVHQPGGVLAFRPL